MESTYQRNGLSLCASFANWQGSIAENIPLRIECESSVNSAAHRHDQCDNVGGNSYT